MSEVAPPIEVPQQTLEVRYPGFEIGLRQITSSSKDIQAMNFIERNLDPKKYGDVDPTTSLEQTESWLKHGLTRNFDSIHPKPGKNVAVGVDSEHKPASEDIIIATNPVDKAGNLTTYSLMYSSLNFDELSAELQSQYSAETNLDMSYVSPTKDTEYNVSEVVQTLQQSTMLGLEKLMGKPTRELSGQLTSEEINAAQKTVSFFADATPDEDQKNYRSALEQAGFKEIHRYKQADEDDGGKMKEYIVYNLPIADLTEAFKQRRSQASS